MKKTFKFEGIYQFDNADFPILLFLNHFGSDDVALSRQLSVCREDHSAINLRTLHRHWPIHLHPRRDLLSFARIHGDGGVGAQPGRYLLTEKNML